MFGLDDAGGALRTLWVAKVTSLSAVVSMSRLIKTPRD
jgi:hypothetical protein